jgi:hypothetical protein
MDKPRLVIEPDPVIEAYKKDIDRTLLRENLKLTVEERLRNLMRLQRFAEEMRQAGQQACGGSREISWWKPVRFNKLGSAGPAVSGTMQRTP